MFFFNILIVCSGEVVKNFIVEQKYNRQHYQMQNYLMQRK
jgi:hypothetical protein